MVDVAVKKWRDKGNHLPRFMRDFHDQKELFKAIHDLTAHEIKDRLGWVDAHIYTIDMFLWFMARHGYTLQRSRKRMDFEDLHHNVERCNEIRSNELFKMLNKE